MGADIQISFPIHSQLQQDPEAVMATKEEITDFSMKIEEIVWMKDISYMDAVIIYCEETGFEVELAAKLISGALKSKIKLEAQELHFLPKSNTAKLPI
jgi:hypothetical protein